MNYFLVAGSIMGLAIYFITCAIKRCAPTIAVTIESGLSGALVCAGLHLSFAALLPKHLVHLTDATGTLLHHDSLYQKVGADMLRCEVCFAMGEIHTLHIFVAGAATVVAGCLALWKFCSEAGHSNQPH